MNTAEQETIAPEVRQFLSAVRDQLVDLDPEEQRDILDGLEADLTDLVAERGGEALGDPVAYARELRTAAGLGAATSAVRRRMSLSDGVHTFLDDVHARWSRLARSLPGDAEGILETLRPVWWVLRGWLAVQVAALWLGDRSLTVVPGGEPGGFAAVVLGVGLSVQLGRGRLWPADGWRHVAVLRLGLLALNCFALVMVPAVLEGLDRSTSDAYSRGFGRGVDTGYANGLQEARSSDTGKAGLYLDGTWVSNIYPYDAKGRPLVGVQLFNQVGKPIDVVTQPEYPEPQIDDNGVEIDANGNPIDPGIPLQPRVFYPWTNGAAQLFNVFPIPSRVQDGEELSTTAFAEEVRPTVGPFPLASVPEVSLPGVATGRLASER